MSTPALPRIAIALGDPEGIGPEIAVKTAHARRVMRVAFTRSLLYSFTR